MVSFIASLKSYAIDYRVRPSTGEYGLEDGSSYDNAFDGFSDISGPTAGDRVYICGTFDEQLTIGVSLSGVEFSWDCPEEAGVIDRNNANASKGVSNNGTSTDVILTNPVIHEVDDYAIILDSGNSSVYMGWTITGGDISTCTDSAQTCIRYVGTNVTIQNVTIHDCYTDCIWGKGASAKILNNTVYDVAQTGANSGDGIQISESVDGTVIRGNVINHDDYDSKYCIISTGTGVVRIEGNTCVRGTGYTTGAGIYIESNAEILGNRVTGGVYNYQCANASSTPKCLIAGNWGYNATTYSVSIGNNSTSAEIYNNVLIGKPVNVNNTGAVRFRNNIFYNSSIGILANAGSSATENYNIFDTVTVPFSIGGVSQSIGANSINGSANLVGNGPEVSTSTNGTHVYPLRGVNGKCVGQTVNIGAICASYAPYGYTLKPKKRRN